MRGWDTYLCYIFAIPSVVIVVYISRFYLVFVCGLRIVSVLTTVMLFLCFSEDVTVDGKKVTVQYKYMDENSRVYYAVWSHSRLPKVKSVDDLKKLNDITVLGAEIKTGKKTLLEYLKPIYMSAYEAFRER